MSKKRWIKLFYGIKDSAVWSDPLRLKAWLDILLSANYKDKEWFKNGQPIKVNRGQFVTSIRKLSLEWKCSRDTVRRILKQFDDLDMIRHEVRPGKYTLITVVKYGVFQDVSDVYSSTDKATDKDTDEYTDKATDKDTDTTQHKNIKNIKKEKKEEEPEPHLGGPDGFGDPPVGWDDECEERYQYDHQWNPKQSRQDWWEFWKE